MSESVSQVNIPQLADLEIEPGNITFDPDVTEYTISVAPDVTKILVRPLAAETSHRYIVSGNSNLVRGDNLVTVTVTSAEGMTNQYLLHVVVGGEGQVQDGAEGNALAADAQTTAQTLASDGSYFTGKTRILGFVIIGCLVAAVVLGAVYFVHKKIERKKQEEERKRRHRERIERRRKQERAQKQQEELLQLIDLLTEKSKKMQNETRESGLLVVELDEEDRAMAAAAVDGFRQMDDPFGDIPESGEEWTGGEEPGDERDDFTLDDLPADNTGAVPDEEDRRPSAPGDALGYEEDDGSLPDEEDEYDLLDDGDEFDDYDDYDDYDEDDQYEDNQYKDGTDSDEPDGPGFWTEDTEASDQYSQPEKAGRPDDDGIPAPGDLPDPDEISWDEEDNPGRED